MKWIYKTPKLEKTISEYQIALRNLEIARQNFENADEEYIDAAIYELNAAELKLENAMNGGDCD